MNVKTIRLFVISSMLMACNSSNDPQLQIEVYETSASGNKLSRLSEFQKQDQMISLKILP
jgi:glucosylceramidase